MAAPNVDHGCLDQLVRVSLSTAAADGGLPGHLTVLIAGREQDPPLTVIGLAPARSLLRLCIEACA